MPGSHVAVIAKGLARPGPNVTGDDLAFRIAVMLAESGRTVTLCVAGSSAGSSDVMDLRTMAKSLGVTLACLHLPPEDTLRQSLASLAWLQSADCHTAMFVGCEELAFFPCLARKTRTGLLDVGVIVVSHDPTPVAREREERFVKGAGDLLDDDLAARSIIMADRCITTNAQAAAWVDSVRARSGESARSAAPIHLPCPPIAYLASPTPSRAPQNTAQRLVLCGSLASAAGLQRSGGVFERFPRDWPPHLLSEVVLASCWGRLPNGESCAGIALSLANKLGLPVRFRQPDEYMTERRTEAPRRDHVVFMDDSPSCFDFLASLASAHAVAAVSTANPYAGLFAETVPDLLFDPGEDAAASVGRRNGLRADLQVAARKAVVDAAEAARTLLLREVEKCLAQEPLPPFSLERPPKVSVCISHFNRPHLLEQAIVSLERQDYPNLEVIIVDDCSPSSETKDYLWAQSERFSSRGWRILYNTEEKWQQASRNIAATEATGDYILIMDDDNCARPDEISTMVRVATALSCPIVRCLQSNFEGEDYPSQDSDEESVDFFPVGGPLSVGTMWNVFGDVNVLYRREVFLGLGGFTVTDGLGCEDFEIGIRAALANIEAITIPRVLYDYRISAANLAKSMDNKRLYHSHARLTQLYEERVSEALRPVFRLLNHKFHHIWQRDGHAYWSRPRPAAGSFRQRVRQDVPLEDEASFVLAGLLVEECALEDAALIIGRLEKWFPTDLRIAGLQHQALLMRGDLTGAARSAADAQIETPSGWV